MYETCDPARMTSAERFEAIAAILGRGVLRLRESRGEVRILTPENIEKSADAPLEVSDKTVLSVTNG